MGHYAKIENGVVTKVLVVDDSAIKDFPGQWVQTSYNTHAGEHCSQDGEKDACRAVRKNFAAVGYIYDAALDAFYPPAPSQHHRLDTSTCQWFDTRSMETKQAELQTVRRKTVYISAPCALGQDTQALERIQEKAGVIFTNNFTQANTAVLTTSSDLMGLLEDPLGRRIAPVTWEIYQKLMEEAPLQAYGVPILTPQEAATLPCPIEVVVLDVAINTRQEALFWGARKGTQRWIMGCEPTDCESLTEAPAGAQTAVQAAVKGLGMPAGLHTVTFTRQSGYWFLVDWQPLLREDCVDPKALVAPLQHLVS